MNVQNREELWAIAGEYVLGALSPTDAAEIERLMEGDQEWQTAVYFWQDRLFGMEAIAPPLEPAPELWQRLENRIAAINPPQATPSSRLDRLWNRIRRTNLWQSVSLWQSTSAIACSAAIALALVALQKPADQTPEFAAILQASKDNAASWIVQGDAHSNLQVIPLVQPVVNSNKALQLWALTDPQQKPVSLGLMRRDRSMSIPANRLPALKSGQLFAVSLEPPTGSPTGLPTGPILYKGRVFEVR